MCTEYTYMQVCHFINLKWTAMWSLFPQKTSDFLWTMLIMNRQDTSEGL